MATKKAAVAAHTAPKEIGSCPVMSPGVERELKACVSASRGLSKGVMEFLSDYSDEAQARWLKSAVEAVRPVFQPWTMELLFALALLGDTRFSQMQRLLDISSRTLSDKLQALRDQGLVERLVYDEQPVRIEYRLTKEGRVAAALATPLFGHLHHQASK